MLNLFEGGRKMNKANKSFYVGAFLAGSLGHWIISMIITALGMAYPQTRPILSMVMLPASLLSLLSAVVAFILVYKMWAAIQGRGARTSAGKALGFMFIPFFNFYWCFQVYWGWTKDYNRIPESDDAKLPSMPENIGLAVCILPIVSMLLVFAGLIMAVWVSGWKGLTSTPEYNLGFLASMLVGLVTNILMAILFAKACDGINALVDAGLEPIRPEYAVPREDAKTSGMAIASLVLGICGFCTAGIAAIVGLILGIVGLSAIKKSQGWLKGNGLAIAGIAVSATALLMIPIMMAIMFPALYNTRNHARTIVSMNYAKQLCLAMVMYCDENEGSLPPADNWPDALNSYINNPRILTSPVNRQAGRAWAMNEQLKDRKISDIKQPAGTVLIFECRFGSPPAGGIDLLPESPRGPRGYVIGFLDGHTECVRPQRLDQLIWTPGTEPFEIVR
jgi:MFS family permease